MNKIKKTNTTIQTEIVFYIVLGVIFFIIDVQSFQQVYSKCNNKQYTMSILLIHHIFVAFKTFGWLSQSLLMLKLHVYLIIMILICQAIHKGKCPLTLTVNQMCNQSKHFYLRDLLYFANLKNDVTYMLVTASVLTISCYKIKSRNENIFELKF